jgi:hypothetical protein
VKESIIQPDIDERRSKWIAKILEFDLEIKPTKLVKGQGLAKLLAKYNCKALGVNFINTLSENQQAKFADISYQGVPPLAGCTYYKDIIYFMQELRPLDGMGKERQELSSSKKLDISLLIKFCIGNIH